MSTGRGEPRFYEYAPLDIPNVFGGPVLYVPETGSVMEDAAASSTASSGAEWSSGTVLLAGYQRAGRGRGEGRRWLSEPDESLLAAVLLARRDYLRSPGSLSIRTALAIAQYLEERGFSPQIKWPNDLLLRRRKVSGILCELSGNMIRIGIGLNCLQRDFPPSLRGASTSLVLEGGDTNEPRGHLQGLLPYLKRVLNRERIAGEAEQRLYQLHREAVLLEGSAQKPKRLFGEVVGVQEDGALLFCHGGITRAVYAGEFALHEPGSG